MGVREQEMDICLFQLDSYQIYQNIYQISWLDMPNKFVKFYLKSKTCDAAFNIDQI